MNSTVTLIAQLIVLLAITGTSILNAKTVNRCRVQTSLLHELLISTRRRLDFLEKKSVYDQIPMVLESDLIKKEED